jgi:hypothetical protein
MTTPEEAYEKIQRLVTGFKGLSAAQRRKMNEPAT